MLGVGDGVKFLGKVDFVAGLLASADVFLLPTDSESFGLSALEALASGTPVIGAAAGGLPEVVRDGVTGYLCPVGDVEAMSAAALRMLRHPDLWAAMSQAGASDARERFALDDIVARYEQFYRSALT